MTEILFHYERVNPASWAYLSSLLMIALFFKFSRIWSVRNLDLLLLIGLAPGLLLVHFSWNYGAEVADPAGIERLGFTWLFVASGLLLVRLLLDPSMLRRPLLEPNINVAGMVFMTGSFLFFLMANVVTGQPSPADLRPARPAEEIKEDTGEGEQGTFATDGPGYWLLYLLPRISTQTVIESGPSEEMAGDEPSEDRQRTISEVTARVMAILSHCLIVLGIILVGYRHFGNLSAGLAASTMYLMVPYTALWTGDVRHAPPAALLVWAVVLYRRPLLSGTMIGLASGTFFYPAFLLPLWCSYYWKRGVKRFATGVILMIAVLVITMAFTSPDWEVFRERFRAMFGLYFPKPDNLEGVWAFWSPYYRYPILAAFVVLSASFAFWPVTKNLATLLSCSAAIMVAAQFWHAHYGGVYVAWYLPLLLLTIYRPNLEDNVAERMIAEGWWSARKRAREAATQPA